MPNLADAIDVVASRVEKLLDKSTYITEQDTKSALVTPILRALGWDCEDPDEVRHEYRHRPQDNPVDYALRIGGKPRLYVEAKSLGRDLGEYKWGLQTINYANGAGVNWCVLTDGNSWRIYKSNADEELEQKLLLETWLYDPEGKAPPDGAAEVLSLLSKESIAGDELNSCWQSLHIERQGVKALCDLIEKKDASLVRLIRQRTKLSRDAIHGLLSRTRVVVEPAGRRDTSLQNPSRTNGEQQPGMYKRFWEQLLGRAKGKTKLHSGINPSNSQYMGTPVGKRGLTLYYAILQHNARVELFIDRGSRAGDESKTVFDRLARARSEIEASFGGPVVWQRLEGKRACRISQRLGSGGYRDDEAKWPATQDAMIDAMIRLEKALRPHVERLKV